MKARTTAFALMLFATAGCAARTPEPQPPEQSPYAIPPQVVAIAAPDQDLTTAELSTADDCYWYYHAGRVETTRVPLRAANGNQICKAPAA